MGVKTSHRSSYISAPRIIVPRAGSRVQCFEIPSPVKIDDIAAPGILLGDTVDDPIVGAGTGPLARSLTADESWAKPTEGG